MDTTKRVVEDAIILAAGLGTRMLPVSRFVPKEFLPLFDLPIINHLILEASKAKVKRIHIVTSPNKKIFFNNLLAPFEELEQIKKKRPDIPIRALDLNLNNIDFFLYEQEEPKGIGDAMLTVLENLNAPFLLMLGDNILLDKHLKLEDMGISFASSCSQKLVKEYSKLGLPCVGVIKVDDNLLDKYGIVKITDEKVESIVEKPKISDAPSKYAMCGRYILPENSKDILTKFSYETYGELQSIKLFEKLISNPGLLAIKFDKFQLYDSGDPFSWLKSQVDHTLRREDYGKEFYNWLNDRINS